MNVDKSNYVLITGASSGIGFALAEQFAKKGSPLICTARNGEKLNAKAEYLRGRYKVKVEEFTQDLSVDNGAGTLYQKIRNANLDVGIVINNDGFNEAGYFINTDLGREVDLINVHLTAVIELSKLFL